jgi:hypothetical protein
MTDPTASPEAQAIIQQQWRADCSDCKHPVASHDDYGCAKWLPRQRGAKMCPCDKSRRELFVEMGDLAH